MTKTAIHNTISHLRLCQKARKQGYPVSYATDPLWLVQQAINRRGGFLDDPGCFRGSCRPVTAKPGLAHRDARILGSARFVAMPANTLTYPRKAVGETFNHLRNLARKINTPRLIVRDSELGEWRKLLTARMPNRFYSLEDF